MTAGLRYSKQSNQRLARVDCLEKYRAGLVSSTNRHLRTLLEAPDEQAAHEFRVGIKRLNALYRLLNGIDQNLPTRKWIKPARALFKRAAPIRETQILQRLIVEFDDLGARDRGSLNRILTARIRTDHRAFTAYARERGPASIRLPTIRTTGLKAAAILRHKPAAQRDLLTEITAIGAIDDQHEWHGKRILLKRYHHIVDAFAACPGEAADERIMKQVVLLEQLLGDWHDRVISAQILRALPGPAADRKRLIDSLQRQGDALLESARLYLRKLAGRISVRE